ncbi:MAG: EpsI family protein [Rugosibacter sp.]|jgi:EpsI family protein|nr:EpsI family protein [Rugosibacter sp.]MDO9272740.1 EpsI family protein [Rugosibacter sp.]
MNLIRKSLLLLTLMCAASALAVVLHPTQKIADQKPAINLEAMIPQRFGDWHEVPQSLATLANPQQIELLNKIYNQTLSRTYSNSQGYRIMFLIAYGGDQSDGTQVHKPEVCYPAQGFQLLKKSAATIVLPFGSLLVTRVDAELGQRREPITYWITIGDQVVQSGIQKKLIEMRYGFTGKIPDGLLTRVSSIDQDTAHAYDIQEKFINQMLGAVTPEQRQRLAGSLGKS